MVPVAGKSRTISLAAWLQFSLSRTVKDLRFHPICKLFPWMLTEDTRQLSKKWNTFTAKAVARVSDVLNGSPSSGSHWRDVNGPRCRWTCIPSRRTILSLVYPRFRAGSKQVCSLLGREILPHPSRLLTAKKPWEMAQVKSGRGLAGVQEYRGLSLSRVPSQ